jgi:RHS repeat-associated protein
MMPAAVKHAEEIFSLAAGVAAALETQSGQKPHQGIFSENRSFHISAEWVKCSGTHQVSEWCASEIVLGPTIYLYDGSNLVEELDQSGNALARYTHNLVLDEPLAQVRSGSTSYYQADGSGSITSLALPSSAIAATYSYDSFGNITTSTGSTTNPFRYVGREFDVESAIYYNRARYFDQTRGRFISEDPVGFSGGLNFYAYVRNNPVSFVDPMGLCTQVSPWVQVPSAGPPAQPFQVVPDGLNWHRVDWGFATSLKCWCDWVADTSREKAYYHYTIVESAKFKCEPCDKIVNKTRTRTEDIWKYREGNPVMPTQRRRTWGTPYRTGEYADDAPSTESSGCTCKAPVN